VKISHAEYLKCQSISRGGKTQGHSIPLHAQQPNIYQGSGKVVCCLYEKHKMDRAALDKMILMKPKCWQSQGYWTNTAWCKT